MPLAANEEMTAMSTNPLTLERALSERELSWGERGGTLKGIQPLDLVIQASFHADPRRIFHALTVPEYLETWMALPDASVNCHVVALRVANSFRIDFYRSNALDASVTGSFRIQKQDKLLFTWSKFGESDDVHSIVDIVLQGSVGRCTLELRHSGLRSGSESRWHQRMWSASLQNLAMLF
jgi:uncharacterized protein YndB with AHSA1/START domain